MASEQAHLHDRPPHAARHKFQLAWSGKLTRPERKAAPGPLHCRLKCQAAARAWDVNLLDFEAKHGQELEPSGNGDVCNGRLECRARARLGHQHAARRLVQKRRNVRSKPGEASCTPIKACSFKNRTKEDWK